MIWKHVVTKINLAGLVCRGATVDVLTSNDLLLSGPLLLQKLMNHCPYMKLEPVAEGKMEFKKNILQSNPIQSFVTTIIASEQEYSSKEILKVVKDDVSVSHCRPSKNHGEFGELMVDKI